MGTLLSISSDAFSGEARLVCGENERIVTRDNGATCEPRECDTACRNAATFRDLAVAAEAGAYLGIFLWLTLFDSDGEKRDISDFAAPPDDTPRPITPHGDSDGAE